LHSDNDVWREKIASLICKICVCPRPKADGSPCGVCDSCSKIEAGTWSELFILAPSSKSGIIPVGDNESDTDSVRWFENLFYFTSISEAGKKAGIILDADRMRQDAQNVFLKTLEEPPRNTVFVLATGNPASLLPTVRSRCQTLVMLENRSDMSFEGSEDLYKTLGALFFDSSKDLAAASAASAKIAALADGLFAQAERAAAGRWNPKIEALEKFEESQPGGKFKDRTIGAEKKRAAEKRDDAAEGEYRKLRNLFLSAVHTWFAQLHMLTAGAAPEHIANMEIMSAVRDRIASADPEKARRAAEKAAALVSVLRWNVSEDLAFGNFCLEIAWL
jgi:hypothetical protein